MPSQAAKWQQVLQRKMQSMAEKPMNIRHMNMNELVNKLNFWYGFEIILDFQLSVQNKKKKKNKYEKKKIERMLLPQFIQTI